VNLDLVAAILILSVSMIVVSLLLPKGGSVDQRIDEAADLFGSGPEDHPDWGTR
jgi:hypothetical protein